MIVKDILKFIYSPIKAFESIAKKPSIKGLLIILALVLVSSAIEQYVITSKVFIATRTPGNDDWTEPRVSHSWNWTSNGINGTVSFVNSTYVIGNFSIMSVVSNDTSIWMKLTNMGPLNCVGDEGYKSMSFWMNWTHQLGTSPSSSTLRLFSINESRYFDLNLADLISDSSGEWSATTLGVAVGPDSQDWISSSNNPSWGDITDLEFMLNWASSQRANLTMNIDDLYFVKKSVSFFTTKSPADYFITSLVNTVIGFFLTWIIYMGSFFVVSGGSREKVTSWRALFIGIGYIFAVAIVGILVRAVLYLTLPALNFPVSSWPQLTTDDYIRATLTQNLWYSHIAYTLTLFANFSLDIWILALYAVAIRTMGQLSWKRAVVYAAFAYFIKFFLFGGSLISLVAQSWFAC